MVDVFNYKSPLGILGNIVDVLFLKRYMANLLKERNRIIKQFAEDPALNKKVLSHYCGRTTRVIYVTKTIKI